MQAACQNPLAAAPHADRILVIRLGALGDVVRTFPAFGDLRRRYPRAHIAWLVERRAQSAVRALPGVDSVLLFPREELEQAWRSWRLPRLAAEATRFARSLRRERFELVLDFHSILKSGALSWLSGAPVRVGYAPPFAREGSWRFATHRARIEPERISRYERNAALIDFLGIGVPTLPGVSQPESAALPVDPEARLRLGQLLAAVETGEATSGPAVIHPSTSAATPYKRYPAESWASVARLLSGRGVRVLVSLGPSELDRVLAEEIVARSDGAAVLAPPSPNLADLAALYSLCSVFLGSDSGPLHVASMVGTPVVQVLGPTDPIENRAWAGTPSRSLRVPVGCSPCRHGCRPAPCMQLILPQRVAAAALELIAEGDPPRPSV